MSRQARKPRNPFWAGVIAVIIIAFASVVAFKKDNPFTRDFQVGVVVQDAAGIKQGSPIRIAGVDVGKVAEISRYQGNKAALITMGLTPEGLPVREDARVRIRPRLFLEGNFVLDLSPGTPGAEKLDDGDTIPITQTSRAVQLDELFNELQGPEREALQTVIQQFGITLGGVDPSDPNAFAKGQTAGESLNDTIKAGAASGRDVERVMRALQGQDRGDLAAAIESLAKLSGPLADNADDVGRLMDGLDRTVSVFSENQAAVRAGITQLPKTLAVAETELPKIRASLPPIEATSRNVTRALPQLPGLVEAAGPFLTQSEALLADDEAGALVESLEPISAGLAKSAPELAGILTNLDRLSVCTTEVLVPTANQRITKDFDSGLTTWQEFLRSGTALASGASNYDANGPFARAAAAQGSNFRSGPQRNATTQERLIGVSNAAPSATIPRFPTDTKLTAEDSPWRFDQACTARFRPSLNSVPFGGADGSTP